MAKVSRPAIYFLVLAVGSSAYFMMGGEGSKPKSSISGTARSSKAKTSDLYLKEDYQATFARISGNSKNAFTPMVARQGQGSGPGPDSVPADMAMGDPNWVFTGSSDIDGASNALFENRVTFESEFAKLGERWKNCSVSQISEGRIILTSRTGRKVELRLAEPADQFAQGPGASNPNNGFSPVNPALNGPIGGRPVAIRPDGAQATARGRSAQEFSNAN